MLETGLPITSLNNKFHLFYVTGCCKLVIQTCNWYLFMEIVLIDSFCNDLFLFYVYWCFTCMHVCMRASDPPELELKIVVSYPMGDGN